jgi:tetratricopeptide (TPR) repeat protein
LSDRPFRWSAGAGWSSPVSFKVTGASAEVAQPFLSSDGAKRLLGANPQSAAEHARKLLLSNRADPNASYVLGAALRRLENHAEAAAILKPLTETQPQMQAAWRELGMASMRLGEHDNAVHALLKAIDLDYFDKETWYALGDLLEFPAIANAQPGIALTVEVANDAPTESTEQLIRGRLQGDPDDACAIKLLADIALQSGRWSEAEALLERCIELAPCLTAARFRFVTMRIAHRDLRRLLPHIDVLIEWDPLNVLYLSLKALTLWWSQQFDAAISEFDNFIERCTDRPGLWLEYARLLRAANDTRAAEAHARVLRLLPSFVDAYINFANIKSFRAEEELLDQLRKQLARSDLAPDDRAKLHYVLGKALEDQQQYEASFDNYRHCNEILRSLRGSAIESSNSILRHSKALFTPAFFRERTGIGCTKEGPIFIVGMPRAGSTLVEQILSSHSEVEALGERNDLMEAGRRLAPDRPGDPTGGYPSILQELDAERFRLIGEEYLETTGTRRHYGTRLFTDKMPGNHLHIGLIHLALPNARIIDIRRHPLDCCFSCYKHYFQSAHSYSLDLNDVGRFYSNYVELMTHFDEVLPGRVHRVFYETLVSGFETEVRRLLDFVGLPFEEDCLRFHENQRLVLTLSADQVNKPLYSSGMGQWRNYEAWLEPLKKALGAVLELYPKVPHFGSASALENESFSGFGKGFQRPAFTSFSRRNPAG